jgi:hypothetical protein
VEEEELVSRAAHLGELGLEERQRLLTGRTRGVGLLCLLDGRPAHERKQPQQQPLRVCHVVEDRLAPLLVGHGHGHLL